MIDRALIGLAVSLAISLLGWRLGALAADGAVAALLVGTGVIWGTSWPGALVLGAFFVSSSGLSRAGHPTGVAAKGSRRDASQVLANGGVALACAVSGVWAGERLAFSSLSGALAAATADTWATEIGSRSRRPPRLLLARRQVPPGTSGGVTAVGALASVSGAALIGGVSAGSAAIRFDSDTWLAAAIAINVAGLLGALADSVLGETLQERRYCAACGEETEAIVHRCATLTQHVGGVRGITNEVVNLGCTLTGAVAAVVLV